MLEAGSPKPFVGKADSRFPELDTQDRLYVARFLVRGWGWDVFERSAYYEMWVQEAKRAAERPDFKKEK